jgi:hypothetical protein
MSWPDFGFQRPEESPSAGLPRLAGNHLMAKTSSSEASTGRGGGMPLMRSQNKTLD